MFTRLEERIKVYATFGDGMRVKPLGFVWAGRKYRIEEITYTWQTRKGRDLIQHFTVTDGANIWEICYNAGDMTWQITGVETEG